MTAFALCLEHVSMENVQYKRLRLLNCICEYVYQIKAIIQTEDYLLRSANNTDLHIMFYSQEMLPDIATAGSSSTDHNEHVLEFGS